MPLRPTRRIETAGMNRGEPLIFLVAGEPSGDLLGARLMAALRGLTAGRIAFAGVGGERMGAEGLRSLFPMSELSVMGLVEVLPSIPRILVRLRQTAAAVREQRPAVVVTIDSPGFNTALARRLRKFDRPLVHYVAPSVWAWRAGRVRTMERLFDHVLALLPFEPPYFEDAGLPCHYVGHPAVETAQRSDGDFRAHHGIAEEAPLLAVLPGSRMGEVGRMLPTYLAAAQLLAARMPDLRLVTVTVPTVAAAVTGARWPRPPVVVDVSERQAAFSAADAAIATSGTVTLELAAARTPMVVCYRLSPVSFAIARRLVRVSAVGLVNLVLGYPAVPELLQGSCTPRAVAEHVERLFVDSDARSAQIEAMDRAVEALGGPDGAATPSERAARVVLSAVGQHRRIGHG